MCRLTNVAIFLKKLKFSPCVPERANLRELGKIQFAYARRTRISPPSKCVFFVRLWQCSYFQDCLCVILPTHRYAYYTTRDTRQARHPPPRLLLFCFLSQCYCSAGGGGGHMTHTCCSDTHSLIPQKNKSQRNFTACCRYGKWSYCSYLCFTVETPGVKKHHLC